MTRQGGSGMRQRIDAVDILGTVFDNLSRRQVLDRIDDYIGQGGSHMICTANVDHVLLARRDIEFRAILQQSDLVVADGMGVVYASRLLGKPLKENVAGRWLLPEFASRAADKGHRLFLLGGKDKEMARLAASRLVSAYPGLDVAGIYAPPFVAEFDRTETARMLEAIRRAEPDVLFVCVGSPKQEKWIARNLIDLSARVSIGVGAALDVIAGQVHAPPRWVSAVGLEWLAKLVQDPRRLWRRYLVGIPVFAALVLGQWLDRRRSR